MSQQDQATPAPREDPFASLLKAYQGILAQLHQTTGEEGKRREKSHTDDPRGFCVPVELEGVRGVLAFIPLGGERPLSAKKLAIAAAVLAGRKSSEIAKELRIAESTVVSHLKRMYSQNDARSRIGLMMKLFFSYPQRLPNGKSSGPNKT